MRRAWLALGMTACGLFPSLDGLTSQGSDASTADAGSDDGAGDAITTNDAAPDGGAPIAYVAGTHVLDMGNGKPSWTTIVDTPVQAHDALVVGVAVYQSGAPVTAITVTDDRGDAFTQASPVVSVDGWLNGVIFTALDVAGGVSAVSASSSSTNVEGQDVFVLEYANVRSIPIAVGQQGSAAGLDNMASGPATVTANSVLVGFGQASTYAAPGTGFTLRVADDSALAEDRAVDAAGSYQATATMDADGGYYWMMLMAVLQGS